MHHDELGVHEVEVGGIDLLVVVRDVAVIETDAVDGVPFGVEGQGSGFSNGHGVALGGQGLQALGEDAHAPGRVVVVRDAADVEHACKDGDGGGDPCRGLLQARAAEGVKVWKAACERGHGS